MNIDKSIIISCEFKSITHIHIKNNQELYFEGF